MDNEKVLARFRLPRWEELPQVPLYLNQVLFLLDEWLGDYLGAPDGSVMTRTMVNNYVKLKFIKPPVKRKYDRLAVASLVVIAVLKPVYSIEEISMLIGLALGNSPWSQAYDQFCQLTEDAVMHAFHRTTMEKESNPNDPRDLFWNVCNSFACQMYVRKTYLQDAVQTSDEEAESTYEEDADKVCETAADRPRQEQEDLEDL